MQIVSQRMTIPDEFDKLVGLQISEIFIVWFYVIQ